MRPRLRSWLRRRRLDRELEKELRFHLDEHARQLIAQGVAAHDAHRRARLDLGGFEQVTERVREGRPDAAVDQLLHDLRDALRSLARTPGLTAAVITLIALVIGGNTTVFSIVHGILTKPAPGVPTRDLVTLDLMVNGRPFNGGNSYPNYLDYAAQSTTVRPLLVDRYERFTLTVADGSYSLRGDAVSGNYFDTLGVRPIAGRTFTGEDERAQASALPAVISERVWRRQFASAPDVVGQAMALNGIPSVIVGVAPPRFAGVVLGTSSDIWVPLIPYARAHRTERELIDRADIGMGIFGRLAPGIPLARARAEFAAISRRLETAYPATNKERVAMPIAYSAIATGSLLSRQGSYMLAIFSVITLLTVLIVCANVANLMLARAAARQRELALRQSLGASRTRIVRMLLVEGIVVSLIAWVAALGCAFGVARLLARLLPPDPSSGTTLNADFTPDLKVAAYAMALALLGTVAFTLLPAVRAWQQEVLPWLKAGEHGVVQGRSRIASVLVVMQLAFSVLLVTSAGLAYRSLSAMSRLDLGYRTDHLLLAAVNTAGSAATPDAHRVLLEQLQERMRAIPGVTSVSHARWMYSGRGQQVHRPGGSMPVHADQNYVGPGYLEVLGMAPLAGGEFTRRDVRRANPGAIINRHLAEALWPGESAVGQTMIVGQDQQVVEIVGVMPNALFSGYRRDASLNFVLRSGLQEPGAPGETTFYLKYSGSLDPVAPALVRAVREVDANVPVVAVRTMERQLESDRWPAMAIITLLTVFAVGSLTVAVIGQYAVIAFSIRRRTRDFGVRMALGASSRHILSDVLGEGLRMTVAGLLGGFGLSLVAGAALGGLLYGISPTDARTYAAVFTLLAAASLAASYLPARRATRIDPMQALRQE
jgi:macrolide transport system ATP-binding/permease protein